jgi:hypothetical protein
VECLPGKRELLGENLSQSRLSTTNPTWPNSGLKPSRRGWKVTPLIFKGMWLIWPFPLQIFHRGRCANTFFYKAYYLSDVNISFKEQHHKFITRFNHRIKRALLWCKLLPLWTRPTPTEKIKLLIMHPDQWVYGFYGLNNRI